eukprot:scaffold113630_cov57-Phaeocystis_antarctica.AAC.1
MPPRTAHARGVRLVRVRARVRVRVGVRVRARVSGRVGVSPRCASPPRAGPGTHGATGCTLRVAGDTHR